MPLRQQAIVLSGRGRPALTERDRLLFVLPASKVRMWKQALVIVQPDAVLRSHRELFRRVWRSRSRRKRERGRPPLTDEILALIKQMAEETHTWRRAHSWKLWTLVTQRWPGRLYGKT